MELAFIQTCLVKMEFDILVKNRNPLSWSEICFSFFHQVKVAVQYMRRVIQKKAKFDIMDLNCIKVCALILKNEDVGLSLLHPL